MILTGICLITEDVPRLVAFYSHILNTPFTGDDIHAESTGPGASMAIYSRQAANDQMGFGLGPVGGTGNLALLFRVDDVDTEFERLAPLLARVITKPTTYPWGARAFHFYDPDGNIVDFVQPAHQS